MSGMDRLTELLDSLKAEQAPFIEGGPRHPSKKNAYFRALAGAYESGDLVVAHRRASRAAPAPSDGLREAVDAAWNDAIEAAAGVAEQYRDCWPRATAPDAQYELKQEYLHMANGAKIVGQQVRALRRAVPTEYRCAECDCQNGGTECTWINSGPVAAPTEDR